jgi:hypothetical protein
MVSILAAPRNCVTSALAKGTEKVNNAVLNKPKRNFREVLNKNQIVLMEIAFSVPPRRAAMLLTNI